MGEVIATDSTHAIRRPAEEDELDASRRLHAQCALVNAAVLDPVRRALARLTQHLLHPLLDSTKTTRAVPTDLAIAELALASLGVPSYYMLIDRLRVNKGGGLLPIPWRKPVVSSANWSGQFWALAAPASEDDYGMRSVRFSFGSQNGRSISTQVRTNLDGVLCDETTRVDGSMMIRMLWCAHCVQHCRMVQWIVGTSLQASAGLFLGRADVSLRPGGKGREEETFHEYCTLILGFCTPYTLHPFLFDMMFFIWFIIKSDCLLKKDNASIFLEVLNKLFVQLKKFQIFVYVHI